MSRWTQRLLGKLVYVSASLVGVFAIIFAILAIFEATYGDHGYSGSQISLGFDTAGERLDIKNTNIGPIAVEAVSKNPFVIRSSDEQEFVSRPTKLALVVPTDQRHTREWITQPGTSLTVEGGYVYLRLTTNTGVVQVTQLSSDLLARMFMAILAFVGFLLSIAWWGGVNGVSKLIKDALYRRSLAQQAS